MIHSLTFHYIYIFKKWFREILTTGFGYLLMNSKIIRSIVKTHVIFFQYLNLTTSGLYGFKLCNMGSHQSQLYSIWVLKVINKSNIIEDCVQSTQTTRPLYKGTRLIQTLLLSNVWMAACRNALNCCEEESWTSVCAWLDGPYMLFK